MSQKNWTESEIEKLRSLKTAGKTLLEISTVLGRSRGSVERKSRDLNSPKNSEPVTPAETSVEEDLSKKDESFWKHNHDSLLKKYNRLLEGETAVDRLVTDVRSLAPRSYLSAPNIIRDRKLRTGKPQSAVLELSDTHIGAVVRSNQTLTFGKYDFETFLARLKYLEDSVISIVTEHITTPVPELVVAMLGDMLDGALQHSNEAGQVNPLFNQFYGGAHALAQFLRNLAPYFPKIRVYDVVGNHTRFQNQRKMPTVNRFSNFDKFAYALIRELVRDIPKIEWGFNPQPYQVFEVNGFVFFAGHGDNLRGGDKALGVPNHAIGRLVSTTTQLFNKHQMKAPNYYLVGHLHRNISLPHATGDVIVNGGFVGVDGFGLSEFFTPADPMQKLFFVHPQYGKTATYDIGLKFAEVAKEAPYVMPADFDLV